MHKYQSLKQLSIFVPHFILLRIRNRAQLNKVTKELRLIEVLSTLYFRDGRGKEPGET